MKVQPARCPELKTGLIFSIGMPRNHGGRIFNRDGYDFSLNTTPADKMVEYVGKADILLQEIYSEVEKCADILLADYLDT